MRKSQDAIVLDSPLNINFEWL